MDVILSWSGAQSRKVAETLNGWLKEVLPGIKPWISTEDITKGSAWFPALLGRLEASRLCIICITPENVRSPWLYFEAGAIAGKSTDTRVCSYLIGVEPAQLSIGTLGQFQATVTWQGAIRQLLQNGLLENRGGKGEVFGVTAEGYRVAEELRTKGIGGAAENGDQ